jgi:lipopolysaccharide/colanic/teichoic acid biosynthesis glycosyltransferase
VATVNTVNEFRPHQQLLERLASEPTLQGRADAAVAPPTVGPRIKRPIDTPAGPRRSPVYEAVRRIADILLSAAVILFILPLLMTVAALVWLQDGGPPVFAQTRVGRNGRLFKCFKFRSMVQNAGERLARLLADDAQARVEWALHHKLRKDPRITALGNFLRKSSLDELPQAFNVLSGVMSLVGPRPIVPDEKERYGWRIRHYESVPPGITGLWQISGRSDVSYRRRVAMDCIYVRRRGPVLDIKILVGTVPSVLLSRGAR